MCARIDFNEFKDAQSLPSVTGVALNVMQICSSDSLSLTALATQIQTDPVLAGRFIEIANLHRQAATRPVLTVSRDTMLLTGTSAVRRLGQNVSFINVAQNNAAHVFDYNKFWSHSLAMACVVQAIGEHVAIAPAAELFTCGLLVGIGRLGLAAIRPHDYGCLLEKNKTATVADLMALEKDRFGYDRVQLSAEMMKNWGVPALFSNAVRFSKAPSLSGWHEDSRQQKLVRVLDLAGLIADIDCVSEQEKKTMQPQLFPKAEAAGLAIENIKKIAMQASGEWIRTHQAQRFSQRH